MHRPLLLLCSALLALCAQANDGQALYQPCAACHGSQAQGNPALNAPALAGQSTGYLARQLKHFKEGIRGVEDDSLGQQMRPMAALLADDAAIGAVSDYLAGLPRQPQTATVQGNAEVGYKQYNMKCGACHGPKAEGNASLQAPALAGLDDAYLARQYRNFQQGLRGANSADRFGRQMKMMATTLSDQELQDLLAYLNTLN